MAKTIGKHPSRYLLEQNLFSCHMKILCNIQSNFYVVAKGLFTRNVCLNVASEWTSKAALEAKGATLF